MGIAVKEKEGESLTLDRLHPWNVQVFFGDLL